MRIYDTLEDNFSPCGDFESITADLNNSLAGEWKNEIPHLLTLIGKLKNRNLVLQNFLQRHLKAKKWPELSGAQSFMVYQNEFVRIRINMWPPIDNALHPSNTYRRYLSIGELHNHDYDFFSFCIFGPGYRTQFYQDLGYRADRQIGDAVSLEKKENFILGHDKIMFVESAVDYHEQFWPESFSATVNILPTKRKNRMVRQYVLDSESHIVKAIIEGRNTSV
jgi:hypothetical protein